MTELKPLFALLKQLVSIPSESTRETTLGDFIFQWMETNGLSPQRQKTRDGRFNVLGTLKGSLHSESPKCLLLGGHMDTVSPGKDWERDPFSLEITEEGLGYGLGASDMKGGIACILWTARKLLEESSPFAGTVDFAFFVDEERYSVGAHDYVLSLGRNCPDFAILAEPHFHDIIIGAPGKVLLELVFQGKTGHASHPSEGINAIETASELLYFLNRNMPAAGDETRGSHAVLDIVTNVEGYSLSIPDFCRVILSKQLVPGEKVENFIERTKGIFERTVGRGSFSIEKGLPEYPGHRVEENNLFLKALAREVENSGLPSPMLRVNDGVSDANILQTLAGIPTVLFGPDGSHYHTRDERIDLRSMEMYVYILEKFIRQLLR